MSTIAIAEEALSEGRALFSAAEELRDLFKRGRTEVEALTGEARGAVDEVLSKLRAGLDGFKAQASALESDARPAVAEVAPPASAAPGTIEDLRHDDGAVANEAAPAASAPPAEAPSAPPAGAVPAETPPGTAPTSSGLDR